MIRLNGMEAGAEIGTASYLFVGGIDGVFV